MNIRKQENELFEDWRQKSGRAPFVIDGVPFPEFYLQSPHKTLFVLKDCNLGKDYEEPIFDLRKQMQYNPDPWWSLVAIWGNLLTNLLSIERCWDELESAPIQEGLKRHAFIQLKKKGGIGGISDPELSHYASEDSEEIRKQIHIYSPLFIVATGTGSYLSEILGCSGEKQKTPRGIGYWPGTYQSGSGFYIIDFCHPSNRAGTKVRSAISYGLRDACIYLAKNHENA